MVRDKLTKEGIADAVIKVEDNDHDIRSGQPQFTLLVSSLVTRLLMHVEHAQHEEHSKVLSLSL